MHRMNVARLIPIILRPVNWQETPLSNLQVLPLGAKPVTTWRNRDEALQSIVAEVQKVVDLFSERNDGTESAG